MISTFTVKNFLIFAFFLAVYVQYLIVRLWDLTTKTAVVLNGPGPGPGPAEVNPFTLLLSRYYQAGLLGHVISYSNRTAPIHISYDTSISVLSNAINLYETYKVTKENISTIKALDVCLGQDSSCKTCELSEFIRLFFHEASNKSSADSTLQYFTQSQCFGPRIRKDFAENELESLGTMISLALLTQTFINVNFCKNIALKLNIGEYALRDLLFGRSYSRFSLLSDFDKTQFEVYKNILRDRDSYNLTNTYKFGLNPNAKILMASKAADEDEDDADAVDFEILFYSAPDFPLQKAIARIFLFPKIDEAFAAVFGLNLCNEVNTFDFNINYNSSGQYNVDFDKILGPVGDFIKFSDWRKHSSTSEKGEETIEAMFWDTLSQYSEDEVRILYKQLTGIERLPNGGIERLPKTKVETVNQKSAVAPDLFSFDKSKFTVYIRSDCHPKQLVGHFDFLLKKEEMD